jgi:hypothetical protein
VIRLNFSAGTPLDIAAADLWRLTDELVAADGKIPHAVATAADLRLAIKGIDGFGMIDLTEHQSSAVLALNRTPLHLSNPAALLCDAEA